MFFLFFLFFLFFSFCFLVCLLRFRGGAHPVAALLATNLPGKWGTSLWAHVELKRQRNRRERFIERTQIEDEHLAQTLLIQSTKHGGLVDFLPSIFQLPGDVTVDMVLSLISTEERKLKFLRNIVTHINQIQESKKLVKK